MSVGIQSRCWDVDPSATLDDIMKWCTANRAVDRLFVVARPDNEAPGTLLHPDVEVSVSEIFAKKIIETLWATAWAGTELFGGHAAKVWIVAFDEDVQSRMVSVENSIRGWRHINAVALPEDICLYRYGDSLPTFVSVTHDGEAWVFDGKAEGARFATAAELPLPADLVPPPPDFVVRAS